jgi:hypothetical protein
MKKKREANLHPECTFSPKLNKPRRKKESNNGDSKSKSSRFDRLYQSHRLTQDKLLKKRIARHDEECTFTPKTNTSRRRNKKKPTTDPALTKNGTQSRHDLLYHQARNSQLKKEVARQSLGEECTFTPKLNTRALKEERHALYDYEAIIVAKNERASRKVESELEGCTFSPDINSRSKSGNAQSTSPDGDDVATRLYRNAQERKERLLKMEHDQKVKEELLCSFKPVVNKNKIQSANDTFERLYANAQEQRYAKEIREQTVEYSFKPEINDRSRELARHSDDRSLHDYLYKEGLAKTLQRQSLGDYKTTLRHRREDEEMEHCTFQPKNARDFEKERADSPTSNSEGFSPNARKNNSAGGSSSTGGPRSRKQDPEQPHQEQRQEQQEEEVTVNHLEEEDFMKAQSSTEEQTDEKKQPPQNHGEEGESAPPASMTRPTVVAEENVQDEFIDDDETF